MASVMLFDRTSRLVGIIDYGSDDEDVLERVTALAEPGANHPRRAAGEPVGSGAARREVRLRGELMRLDLASRIETFPCLGRGTRRGRL